MATSSFSLVRISLLCVALLTLASPVQSQQTPVEVGSVVAGYQDDFDGNALGAGWAIRGANVYVVSDGVLHVASAAGDPNHLLYEAVAYNNTVQEVLARIRVVNFGSGDGPRGGVATAVDPLSSQGINFHFRDETSGKHVEFLDDARAWGTELAFPWQLNTWYWIRLRHEPNAPTQGGVNDVFGKIWAADGSVAEPASWQAMYDYIPTRTTRTGFAGLSASSLAGIGEFDVDYVLIKAAGLPNVTVAPRAFVQTPVAITNQPQNITTLACKPVSFAVGVAGNPLPSFQWFRNEGSGFTAIEAATNAIFTIPNVQISDSGSQFRVVVQNVVGAVTHSVTSAAVTLTVSTDVTRPALSMVQALGLSQLLLGFSEPVTALSANDALNYEIRNGLGSIAISNAVLDATGTNVTLTCAPMVEGQTYSLVANNIRDVCAGNVILADSTLNFTVTSYAPQNIGNAMPVGNFVAVPGGYDLTGGGTDIGGTNDQFQFSWQQRTGDFDFKVRLASLGLVDSWTEAGLMVRETLLGGSRFASVMATPSISGCYFQSRSTTNGVAALSGSFPANYPATWLRLQRAGNQFTGFASYDGSSWTALGSATIALPTSLYFGFAVSSHNTNQVAVAAFRDLSTVTSTTTNTAPINVEPLNQSSRRTGLVISEIMYHPAERADGRNSEFIELFNALPEPQDISGFRLAGEIQYQFPTNTVLAAGAFLVVARVPADVQSIYGITGVLGPFANTNNLPNAGGTIRLLHRTGAVLLEVNYASDAPYPLAADGAGHSLILARPSYGEGNPRAWGASDTIGGSPGRLDPVTLDPLRHVVINEILAHTDDPEKDYVELYNHGNQALDLSGCLLSDDAATNKFVLPPGSLIAPRGFLVLYETNFGFALSSHGEDIFLRNPEGRVLDGVRFGAQENGIALGRWPEGAPQFYRLSAKTPGATNAPPRLSNIVINEIMFNPISGNNDDEYIELFNRGTNSIDLFRWRISGGISHTFKAGDVIPAGGYLVVAREVDHLRTRYPNLTSANTVGNFNGSLGNGGERLALSMPEFEISTNGSGQIVTNTVDIVVNEVTYGDGGRWGQWADGGGSSLELIDARADTRLAANWADSDETAKAPWTFATFSGVLDHPHLASVVADHLEMFLQGAGECLIDDIQVIDSSDLNRISNSSFESGAAGWTAEGTQSPSSLETTQGYNSAQSYHVRAVERGDNQVNRIRTTLSATVAQGTRATINAKVRWLRGHPEMLLRLRGNWLELPVTMTLPENLGTPGARNSRALTNGAPALYEVAHHPILPRANEPVVVTARFSDPDGPGSLQLRYRIDPISTYTTAAMNDAGLSGDAVGGDGIFSATIPGQGSGALAAFSVQATDAFGATSLFPDNAPARECLVRFGETQPHGSFPTYRVWMTQGTFNTWVNRHRLNNTPLDVTFVLNNTRAIYNSQALYAGSPYIAPGYNTPVGNRCGYTIAFPSDDRFLGGTDLVLDWPGGHGNEPTAIQEQMAYWMADRMNLPFSHRYFIRLHVNGVTEAQRGTIYEAVLQPAGDFLNQWSFGDEDGDFYKIDRGFEFDDGGNRIADPMPTLQPFVTTNFSTGFLEKKRARYRWTFMKRSFESANNYTNIFGLVDALNGAAYDPYTAHTEDLVDVEQWMRAFAFEHTINNFDSYGHAIGKNMYAYKPETGKWRLYAFDLDWLMLVSVSAGYGTSGDLFVSNDSAIGRMYAHPPFRRAYWRAYQEIVDGPLLNAEADAVMDAKYYALVQNGVTQSEGAALQPPTALKGWWSGRRAFIVSQLQSQGSTFAVSSPSTFTTNNNLAEIRGVAPFQVHTLRFNGIAYPVIWTSQSNWLARLPLNAGLNLINIVAHDRNDLPISGMTAQVSVNYTGASEPAQGNLLINELVYRGQVPDAEYVELFNAATNTTFDLSLWRLNGLDYTFPAGSLIRPRSYLVLARNRSIFSVTYGASVPVFDEFAGDLQNNGETLTLVRPAGSSNEVDVVVDRVRYESGLPWSSNANGTGSSLQLVDPVQENARVLNWFSTYVPPVFSGEVITPARTNGGWRFVSLSGTTGPGLGAQQMRLLIYTDLGSALVDDIAIVPGTNAAVGTNYVRNGDFESSPLLEVPQVTNSWNIGTNYTNTAIVSSPVHGGNGALQIVCSQFANTFPRLIAQNLSPAPLTNAVHTLSFWYWATNSSTNLTVRLFNSAALNVTTNINIFITPSNYIPPQLVSPATNSLSPGAANQIVTNLPAFAPLWINELQAENLTGILDNNGEREPWIEIVNTSTNTVSLQGLYLSSNYTNLLQWAFPAGASIGPMQFLVVFCDGEPGETSGSEYHTSFRLSPGGGSIALSRVHSNLPVALNGPAVLDYVNYAGLNGDRSYGSFPDGQPFDRLEFFYVTPRGTNDGRSAPLVVFINEWMASNTNSLADPADGDYDDWFELYNPGPNAVDLSGYYLTDVLSNPTKYLITTNGPYVIPPQGYLLVWADNETGQNMSGGVARPDLHVNFQLARAGEGLGLFAPDGSQIDAIVFTNQLDDVSEGRFPNGSANIVPMPGSASPRASNYLQGGNPDDPQFTRTVRNGTNLELSWSTVAGRRYAIDYKDNLTDPSWTPLQTNMAAGTSLSFTHTTLAPAQRFFRIRVVE